MLPGGFTLRTVGQWSPHGAQHLAQDKGQDPAVLEVSHLHLAVQPGRDGEGHRVAVGFLGLDRQPLAGSDIADARDGEGLTAVEPQALRILTRFKQQGQNAHPHQSVLDRNA